MNLSSSLFMLIGGIGFLIFFGLPLFIAPTFWARRIGWTIPEDTNLVNYLGRSLGGVVIAIVIMAFMAAYKPWEYRFVFDLVILVGILVGLVHVYGFIKKTQPVAEHLEIILYAGLIFLTWLFYPKPPV